MTPRRRILFLNLFALALTLFVLFWRLGGLPLFEPDEGRNAEVAREMAVSGAWIVPTFNGVPYLDKPAFFFDEVRLSFEALGVHELAARLPSALAGLGVLLLAFWFCRRNYDGVTAPLAVVIAVSSPLIFGFARTVIFDMTLAFFVCLAILAGFEAEESSGGKRRAWYLVGAAAAGFGTLVKGPVGFLITGLVLIVYDLAARKKGAIKRFFSPWNVLVFLAIVLPWFIVLSVRIPDFPRYGLVEESWKRFTTGASFHRNQPFYFYAVVLVWAMLPWSFALPQAIWESWKRRRAWRSPDLLLIAWSLVVVAFFSLSHSKLPGYILTAVVALAILLARAFAPALTDPASTSRRLLLRAASLVAPTLIVLAALLAIVLWPGDPTGAGLGAKLAPLGLRPAELWTFVGSVALAGVVILVARLARSALATLLAFPLICILLLAANFPLLAQVARHRSSRALAQRVEALPVEAEIACLRCFPTGLPFYLERPVTLLTARGTELTSNYFLWRYPNPATWPPRFVPLKSAKAWVSKQVASGRAVLVIASRHRRKLLATLAASQGATAQRLGTRWLGALIKPKSLEGGKGGPDSRPVRQPALDPALEDDQSP